MCLASGSTRSARSVLADMRLAWLTLADAHLEHPEEADHSVEGIVPLRESALNVLGEAIRKRDALGGSPAEEQRRAGGSQRPGQRLRAK